MFSLIANITGCKFVYLSFGLETRSHNCIFDNFFLKGFCCPTLNVLLENDVKAYQGSREGVYTLQGFSNEMDYWFDAEGEHALWYSTTGSSYDWNIGFLADLGSDIVVMYT